MADFPELIPASRAYSLGAQPTTQRSWLDALEVSHRFGDQATAHTLRLEFDAATTDNEWLQIRNHWAGQQGAVLPFAVPAPVWAGHVDYGQIVDGLQWRYASPPSRPDLDAGLGPGTVELVAERIHQPLLSSGAAPWFGAVVPLVAAGADPGPPPPAVPAGVPAYAPIDAPKLTPGVTGQATGEGIPTHASQHGGSYQAAPGTILLGATGTFLSLPLGREQVDETPANSGVFGPSGSKSVETGDPLTYKPTCSDPGTPKWFYQPDMTPCNTTGKSRNELMDMLKNEFGIIPQGLPTDQLQKLYCKGVEASGYGIPTFKNDTVAKLDQRIKTAKSKGKTPGSPIPIQPITGKTESGLTPFLNGNGRIYAEDKCGFKSEFFVDYKSRKMKRPVIQTASVGYGLDYPIGGIGPVVNGLKWAGIGGSEPGSAYGFFIENRLLCTYDDDGEKVILGGGPGGNQAGWVDAYKITGMIDSDGTRSGTYNIQNGQWVYTPPQN